MKTKTVNLSYGEKKSLEMKYKQVMNKEKRKKKRAVKEEEKEKDIFFEYAYNFYFLLDLPPAEAFRAFCSLLRTANSDKVLIYLYNISLDRKICREIRKTYKKSTVDWREELDDRFGYISERMKEMMFRRITG